MPAYDLNKLMLSDQFVARIKARYPGAQILAAVPVAWLGWAMDFEAAVITNGRKPFVVRTNNGVLEPCGETFLREQLDSYRLWITMTEKALAILQDHSPD